MSVSPDPSVMRHLFLPPDLRISQGNFPPQARGITGGGRSKLSLILPAELRRAPVADGDRDLCCLSGFSEQPPPRLLQLDLLMVGKWTHRGHSLEMAMEGCNNIDYVILLCGRMAKTREFHLNVMKFPLEMDGQIGSAFVSVRDWLTLRPRDPFRSWQDGPAVDGSASIQLAFRVPPPAIEECHHQLIAMGVKILSPPKDLPSRRHRTLFFRDPEGNIVEIYAEI
jgi:catechol 2,3-dioxygenase-like lactoylglutathione lyase family enzyme